MTNVTCDKCKQLYDLRNHLLRRPVPEKGEGVDQYVLICPHCQHEIHAYYTNAEIERRQELVRIAAGNMDKRRSPQAERRYRQAQADLRRKFDVLNPPKVASNEPTEQA